MKKLVCDRCGREITEKQDIALVLEGAAAWQAAARNRGIKPRGIFPCENYVKCGGEMIMMNERKRRFFRFGGNHD